MGIRAYKVIEIKTAKQPTFNAGEEFDWLSDYFHWAAYNQDSALCEVEFETAKIDEAIEELKKQILENEGFADENRHQLEILQAIKKDAGKEEFISYNCY